MKRVIFVLLIGLALLIPAGAIPYKQTQDHPTRLFLVYLDADNNLYSYGLSDLEEMTSANRNTSYAKVIVLFDGQTIGDTKLYEVHPGGYEELPRPIRLSSEMNMGSPDTLRSFVLRAVKTYHPNYVFLDLRDHGGARSGLMRDDSNSDHLTIEELVEAIEGLPITILGFDACLMGNIETLYEISTVFHGLVVASTLTEPGDGRDYKRLNVFSSEVTPYDVAKAVVDYYRSYYSGGVTLAVYDLSFIDFAVESIEQMSELYLVDALSNIIEHGSLLSFHEIYRIEDTISGDGISNIHVGTNSTARKAYSVYLEAGTVYNITLDRSTDADLDLYVFEPGVSLDPANAFAYSRYDKPECVTFKATVSGNRTIVVDHYSSETTPTDFVISVKEADDTPISSLIGAPEVYGPLKDAVAAFNNTFMDALIRYAKPRDIVSITIGNPADLDMSMSDYKNLAISEVAPTRTKLLEVLSQLACIPTISVSYTLQNATINGIETIVDVSVSSEEPIEVRLYNLLTGDIIKTEPGSLQDLPMAPYIGYLVYEEDGIPQRAVRIGTAFYGGKPAVFAPSHVSAVQGVPIQLHGYASFDDTIDVYLNGTYVKSVNVDNYERSLSLTINGSFSVATLALKFSGESYEVAIINDPNKPKIEISGSSDRETNVSIRVAGTALKSIIIGIDGDNVTLDLSLFPIDELTIILPINQLRERRIYVYVVTYAGVSNFYEYIAHTTSAPVIENGAPKMNVTYTIENTTVKLRISVYDDDGVVYLRVFVNGSEIRDMKVTNGVRTMSLPLDYGKYNITVVAVDPYNATSTRSEIITINQPPSSGGGATEETSESEGTNRLLISAVIVVAVIVILTIVMLLKRKA